MKVRKLRGKTAVCIEARLFKLVLDTYRNARRCFKLNFIDIRESNLLLCCNVQVFWKVVTQICNLIRYL
jgi:hypothetical protein